MRTLLALASLLLLQQELPPPFPRPGTTLLLENDRVRVWDIAWLKQAYPMHRHPYDMTGVYYQSGDRIIISPEGERRASSTQAWNITFQLVGLTHSEEGASDPPLRSVFIEMKQPSAGAAPREGAEPVFPLGNPEQRLDNERVRVWEYTAPDAATQRVHRHEREAVVVSFDTENRPSVRFVERGAAHDVDTPVGTARTFVFEIK